MTAGSKVVLVGCGHTHVQVLRTLRSNSDLGRNLTVVVDEPTTIYSGMVPGFVAGQYGADDIEIDVPALAHASRAELLVSAAVGIDLSQRTITLENGGRVDYDVASFDVGAAVAGTATPGFEEHVLPVRPMAHFVRRISDMIDTAWREPSNATVRVTIVGGGAAGVELAFALNHRLSQSGRTQAKVTVIEAGIRILPEYPNALVRRLERRAAKRGIDFRLGCEVIAVERDATVLQTSERVRHDHAIWAAGAASQSLFRDSGLSTDKRGFARVRPTLQAEDHGNIFAAGDCAALVGYPLTPKAGVFAVRQAPVLAHNLRAALAGTPFREYRPQREFLTLLNLGDGPAIGTKWGRTAEGRWVMKLKDWVDRRFVERR